jgi:hypothetical protein
MKKTTPILAALFSCTICFSQTTIDLKIVPFEIENPSFYIEKVVDNRQENHLGIIANNFNKKVQLRFENDAATTIKRFLDSALPETSDRLAITLVLKNLKVEEAQTSIDKRTARVYVELYFYAENREELYKVVRYEDQVFPESDITEIYKTHEQRIRAALEYCLRSFINFQKTSSTHDLAKVDMVDTTALYPEKAAFENYVPLGKWFDMLTIKRMTDTYNDTWNISYTGFSDQETGFIIPFVIGYSQTRAKSDIIQERGYSSVDSYALGFGFNGFIKITSGLYVDLGINVPIGMELLRNLENKKSSNFLIGLSTHQGIKIIPWQDSGIVFGAGVFQRWQTSKVINRNFGFALELGINF